MTFLVLGILLPMTAHPVSASTPSQTGPSGLIIPLYIPPGAAWNPIIQAKESHPSIPIVAVVNPDVGPGTWIDPTYATWINNLKAAGIVVVGYVDTKYASESLRSVEAEVSAYRSMYAVNGIFLDDMANKAGQESYYSTISSYAHSLGLSLVIGNPGSPVPASYIGTVDTIVVYESSAAPTIARLTTLTMGLSKSDFAIVSYGVPSLSSAYVEAAVGYVNYIYVTNGLNPRPYAILPSYFDSLVADVSAAASTQQVAYIHVQSLTLSSTGFTGMRTIVRASNGVIIASGFTPFVFKGVAGEHYTVCVENYRSNVFSHWDNWDYGSCRNVTLSQTVWYTAVYGV